MNIKVIIRIIISVIMFLSAAYSLESSKDIDSKKIKDDEGMSRGANSVLPKVKKSILDNKMEVYMIPLKNKSDVITINVIYKVGSRNEIMGKSGIAHMLEHLNFKSTKNLKDGEFDSILKKMGAMNNASTDFDYTQYFAKVSARNMDKVLSLYAEIMQNLSLKDSEFQKEREVVAEERRWRTDNDPFGFLWFNVFNNAFIYHPYHWTPIGFMEDIKNWTIDDIKAFHEIYYQPKNAAILISGDFKEDETLKMINKYFGKIKNRDNTIPKVHTIEPKIAGQKRIIFKKDTKVDILAMAYHIPNYESKDTFLLNVGASILTGGRSSRLYKKIVEEKKLASDISAYSLEEKDDSLFLILATANDGIKAETIEKEINIELENIKNSEITQKEIDREIIATKKSFVNSLDNSMGINMIFAPYIARGNLSILNKYEENLQNVNKDEVRGALKKYIKDDNSVVAILRAEKAK